MELKQGTPEWHAARTGKITGSRVGAILGVSKYKNPDDVMREMVRQAHGFEPEFLGNDATDWGQLYEDEAIEKYVFDYFVNIDKKGIVFDDQYDFLAFSPDGIICDENGFVEVKCPYYKGFSSIYEKPEYYAQVMLGMRVLKKSYCDFIIYYPAGHNGIQSRMIVEKIFCDDGEWFNKNIDRLKNFYEEYLSIVESKTKSAPYLEPLVVEMNDDGWQDLVKKYVEVNYSLKEKEQELNALKNQLIEYARGKSTKGYGLFLQKINKSGLLNYKKIVEDFSLKYDKEKYKTKDSFYWKVTIEGDKNEIV